jgi:Tti2 family
MEDLVNHLQGVLRSEKTSPETEYLLRDCLSLFASPAGRQSPAELSGLLEDLLVTIIKPLFARKKVSPTYRSRFDDSETKLWKTSAPWSLDVLQWTLDQYDDFDTPKRKQALESHFPLLVPPILSLLDDEDLAQKTTGCHLLRKLCEDLLSCHSKILKRTGLTKVFEDSLTLNMLLLPTLTPEDESRMILRSLYPAYRALIAARFATLSAASAPTATSVAKPLSKQQSSITMAIEEHKSRQAMLDTMLRKGLLAGYVHASDYVQIATLLVDEMSPVIEIMGATSSKYLSQLLPLLREIMNNPLGTACQPLLTAAVKTMRQLILQCWPRIADVWWEECVRATIGLWLILSEEDGAIVEKLKEETRDLMHLLVQLKGAQEAQKMLSPLVEEYDQLAELISASQRDPHGAE